MYCQECGAELPAGASECPTCGEQSSSTEAIKAASKRFAEEAKALSKESLSALALFAGNPVGGLERAFSELGARSARNVGLYFGGGFVVLLLLGSLVGSVERLVVPGIGYRGGWSTALTLALGGVVTFASLVGAAFLVRRVFRGEGTLAGDLFFCGGALLPVGVFVLLAGILGAVNFEVILILGVFAFCYSVLILFTGCRRLSGLSDAGAAAAVPTMLLISGWLTKIALSILL